MEKVIYLFFESIISIPPMGDYFLYKITLNKSDSLENNSGVKHIVLLKISASLMAIWQSNKYPNLEDESNFNKILIHFIISEVIKIIENGHEFLPKVNLQLNSISDFNPQDHDVANFNINEPIKVIINRKFGFQVD